MLLAFWAGLSMQSALGSGSYRIIAFPAGTEPSESIYKLIDMGLFALRSCYRAQYKDSAGAFVILEDAWHAHR